MALINCPECNKEVSDKSKVCIHCGYPIIEEKNTKCIINGKEYDLSFIFDTNSEGMLKIVATLVKMTGCGLAEAKKVVENILETNEIPKTLFLQQSKPQQSSSSEPANQRKCKYCGGTSFTPVKRKWSLMTGFMTNKTDLVCNNCNKKVQWIDM